MNTSRNHWLCHEGHLLLPQGYQDRTVNLFTAATTTAPVFSLARDQLSADDTLALWIDRQLAQLAEQLPEWHQQTREPAWLGVEHMAGEVIHCDYRSHGAHIWQQQAVFNPNGAQLLVFTMTHSVPFQTTDERAFTALLRSFTFHPQPAAETLR